jgi:hypothetical protein
LFDLVFKNLCQLEGEKMKKWSVFLCTTIFLLGPVAIANALPFSQTFDWDEETKDGRTATKVFDNGTPVTYQHDVLFNPPAQSITSAALTLSHYGNEYPDKEAWILFEDENSAVQIGLLENSDGVWKDQTFTLAPSLYSDILGLNWILELRLAEGSGDNNTDNIYLDKSVLSGTYEPVADRGSDPVPEPATMLLLGSGLVGLAALGKKKFRRT